MEYSKPLSTKDRLIWFKTTSVQKPGSQCNCSDNFASTTRLGDIALEQGLLEK